jgi:hypothetical protein
MNNEQKLDSERKEEVERGERGRHSQEIENKKREGNKMFDDSFFNDDEMIDQSNERLIENL